MSTDDETFDDNRDYRAFFDATYVRAWDLPPGKNVTFVIDRIERHTIKGNDKEETKRPVVFFRGKKKGLVLNKGMSKVVAALYGKVARAWRGKEITIYATTCQAFGETHDVVRVRPTVMKPRPPRRDGAPDPKALPAANVADAEFEETPMPETVGAAQ